MGVKGLYSFLCKRIEKGCLQESPIEGKLVIDGFNLVGTLYRRGDHSRVEGGEYPAFYEHVRRYFKQLVDCGIEPIVVCDGPVKCISDRKYNKRRREKMRSVEKLSISNASDLVHPLFARQVFIDALESVILEFKIPHKRIRVVYADGDGDSEITALTNDYQCPVLSNDGDFFMFELTAGLVVSNFFRIETKGSKAFGKFFYPLQSFSDGSCGLKFHDPDLRFLLPAILGNDFLNPLKIEYQGQKLTKITEIVKIVCPLDNFPCYPDTRVKLREKYEEAKDYYKGRKVTKLTCLPEWALSCYQEGKFHSSMVEISLRKCCTLDITVEDIAEPNSCHEASKEIREFIQGTLVGEECVKEYVRDQREGRLVCPKPLAHQPWPDLQNLNQQLSRDERMEIVCKVLDYDRQTLTTELEQKWQLVVAASSFWLRRIAPEDRETLTRALVSCFIHCQREYIHILPPNKDILLTKPISSQLPLIHCFSQWQSVYYFTVMLNQLLLEPFRYTSPGLIFDGRRALRFAMLYLHERRSETEVFRCAEDLTLHEKLYRLIIQGDKHKAQEVHQEQVTIPSIPTIPTAKLKSDRH